MIGQGMAATSVALWLLAAASAPAQGPWILSCEVTPAIGAGADKPGLRVFRIAPGVLQEWRPGIKAFGGNLCQSYSCVSEKGRLEGVISSATLNLTISLDPAKGEASWKTVGASNLGASSGACSMKLEAAKAKAGG
jgi:hypothetical protein